MIDDRILALLRDHPGQKAKAIATMLGVDKSIVNAALYGSLKGKVRQDNSYRWFIVSGGPKAGAPTAAVKNKYSDLIRYYLECLAFDNASGVSVFATSQYELDYAEIPELPLTEEETLLPEHLKGSTGVGPLLARARKDRRWTLSLGYPIRVRLHRARNGAQYYFLEPLLVWPFQLDTSESGAVEATLNSSALERLAPGGNTLEELVGLSQELGLDQTEEIAVDELVSRLRDVRPDWDWQELPNPHDLQTGLPLPQISQVGIYNRAAVFLTERQPYTIGLERELHDLETVPDADIEASALGRLLLESKQGDSLSRDTLEIIEPVPLNAEQREAVIHSLTDKLTVITGPPGTGKSQVVVSILLNAAFNNQRVLFSSKNNKAVDVVQERANELADQPILFRLGAKDLNTALADHLSVMLSFQPGEEEHQAFNSAEQTLRRLEGELRACDAELTRVIELRNRLDALDRTADEARSLQAETSGGLGRINVARGHDKVTTLQKAVDSADKTRASIFVRIVWALVQSQRRQRLREALSAVQSDAKALGLRYGSDPSLSELRDLCDGMRDRLALAGLFQQVTRLESELNAEPDAGGLATKRSRLLKRLQAVSRELWAAWMMLLSDRLSDTERRNLGDYVALLKMVVKAENEEFKPEKKLWAQYYAMAAKVTSALPCWAVTSLSVRGRVPFESGLFDVAVIDEASQCDIASALPLMFRAKRVVIIGDPQQLKHISRLDAKRDNQLMDKFGVLTFPGPSWAYGANSLYDLGSSRVSADSVIALRDHHRSHSDIISFSNKEFYRGQLRVATDYARLKSPPGQVVRWIDVSGNTYRPSTGGAGNVAEAQRVVAELRRLLLEQRFTGDVGVVTPFREQANRIQELVNKDDALWALLSRRDFLCQTAHRFQGDERDVILFSPVISKDAPDSAKHFLRRTQNLFNVAITRARGGLWVVGDRAACATSGVDYLEKFVRYVGEIGQAKAKPQLEPPTGVDYPAVANPEQVSDYEKVLYRALCLAGLRPIPQYSADQYLLDLALFDEAERRLDIEVDGERFHRDWNGELTRRDQLRNMRLIEMGWDVMRFWVPQVRDNLDWCVERVRGWLDGGAQPTAQAETVPPPAPAPARTNPAPIAKVVNCPICGREGIYKVCADCGYRTEPDYITDDSIGGTGNRHFYENK